MIESGASHQAPPSRRQIRAAADSRLSAGHASIPAHRGLWRLPEGQRHEKLGSTIMIKHEAVSLEE